MAVQGSIWSLFLVLMSLSACRVSCVDYPSVLRNFNRAASAEWLSETKSQGTTFGNSIIARTSDGLQDVFSNTSKPRNYNLTRACEKSVEEFLVAFDFPVERGWAEQMLDATTKVESGVLQGNILWVGAFEECQAVRAVNRKNEYLFSGMPCSVIVNNVSNIHEEKSAAGMMEAYPGLVMGVCVPDTCTVRDSEHLVNEFLYVFPEDYQAIASTCHKDEPYPLDTPAKGVIVMLSVIGVILVIATLYDLLYIQSGLIHPATRAYRINEGCEAGEPDDVELLGSENEKSLHDKEIKAIGDGKRGAFPMLMLRLSVYSNAAKLLSTERSEGSLDALHGIRFLSLSWVILGHTYIFSLVFIQNITILPDVVKGLPFQAIVGASVSVDTFFLLSGTLVAYPLLNAFKSKGGPLKINWLLFYFHRFWRLTPPYMIILGAHTALFKYLGTGPFWKAGGIEKDCPSTWWANFIYLNNVLPDKTSCMGWTWYLANDMQFYIVSPLFLIALYKWRVVGGLLCLVPIVISVSVTAALTKVHGYIPDLQGLMSVIFKSASIGDWFTQVYISPWCRIGPYMVGLLLGFLLHKTERKVPMKWYIALLGWAVAVIIGMSVVYGLWGVANNHPLSPEVNALYAGMHRVAWAVAVAWVIFACLTGHGGPVNTLLSWSPFIPLSRLTYMAYLIHPIVIYWFYLSRKTPTYFDHSMMMYFFLGHLCLSYALAFVASLSFESPMLGLEKVAFARKKPQPQSS